MANPSRSSRPRPSDGPGAEVAARLAPLGAVRARRMFGGEGIFLGERMFALIAYGDLYLKADTVTEPAFRAAGEGPFVYEAKGKRTVMSYWKVPADVIEDDEALLAWAADAVEVAARAAAVKPKRARTGRA